MNKCKSLSDVKIKKNKETAIPLLIKIRLIFFGLQSPAVYSRVYFGSWKSIFMLLMLPDVSNAASLKFKRPIYFLSALETSVCARLLVSLSIYFVCPVPRLYSKS